MTTTVIYKLFYCDSPVSLEVGPDVLGPGEVPEDDLPLGLHDLLRLAGRVVLPQQRQGVRHGCWGDTGRDSCRRLQQGGSNGVKKCDMEDPNVGESIIGFKMDINNMQCYHIE